VILFVTLSANVILIVAWGFLGAFIGMGVIGVEIIRDIVSYLKYKFRKPEERYKIKKSDWIMLFFYISALILITIFTYEGYLSLFAFFAVLFFTIGIWQKNRLIYLICAIFSEASWIVYNIYIESVFGLAWEIVLFIAAIGGLILFLVNKKRKSPTASTTLQQ